MADEVMLFITEEQLEEFRKRTVKEAVAAVRKEEGRILQANDPVKKARSKLKRYRQLYNKYREEYETEEFTQDEIVEIRYECLKDLMDTNTLSAEISKFERRIIDEEKERRKHVYELRAMNEAANMLYEQYSKAGPEALVKYDVLVYTYFEEQERTMEEIADACKIAKRTAYKYLNEAIEMFAFYLYGM